jgi:branched-subunit amino acid aminotransferase/4-amino-4-deoxychorismate lyase
MGVFEGVRAYETEQGTAIFRLKRAYQRLLNSAKIFQMKVPYDLETLMDAQRAVIRENNLNIRLFASYYLDWLRKNGHRRQKQHHPCRHCCMALGCVFG